MAGFGFLHDTVIQQVPCPLRARVDTHILRSFVTKRNCKILVAGTGISAQTHE